MQTLKLTQLVHFTKEIKNGQLDKFVYQAAKNQKAPKLVAQGLLRMVYAAAFLN